VGGGTPPADAQKHTQTHKTRKAIYRGGEIVSPELTQQVFKEALLLVIQVAGPLLIVSMIVGLTISIFQAATQIHDQTLTFVPKALVLAALLFLLSPAMVSAIQAFIGGIFEIINQISRQMT
jgi:flagellar biosynthetic protein FliQ